MEIPKLLTKCLEESGVFYEIVRHPEAVTALRVAQAEHIKARHHAKVVMVKSNGSHLMAVIPADQRIDLQKVEKLTGKPASLETEEDFRLIFPDCALGAMPPFGNLYGVRTIVDQTLTEQDFIVFEAGTHTDAIKLKYCDYERIVGPRVADLTL